MAEIKEKNKKEEFNLNPEEMAKAGLVFGHRTSKTHPKMKEYISGVRNTVHIIDVEKTAGKLKEALEFVQKLISENKILLLVGTKIQSKQLVKEVGKEIGIPYISERWLGGTFTNFETIKKRVEYLKNLEAKKEAGELEKYTKKERAKFDKEINDLENKIGGIKNMDRLPDAIFVLDMIKDELAAKESRKKGIPVIAVCDTNINPELADYIIPASDDSVLSAKYILEKIKEVVLKTKTEAKPTND